MHLLYTCTYVYFRAVAIHIQIHLQTVHMHCKPINNCYLATSYTVKIKVLYKHLLGCYIIHFCGAPS